MLTLHKKWSFPFSITEEILNGKLHFLCSASSTESNVYLLNDTSQSIATQTTFY